MDDLDIDKLEEIEIAAQEPEPEEKKPKAKRSRSRSSGSSGSVKRGSFKGRIEAMIKLAGQILSGFDQYDGSVIIESAGDVAEQLDILAKESPRVRKFIESALETGAWSGVIGVVGMEVVLPIAVHHRMLPDPINSTLAELREIPVREPKPEPDHGPGVIDFGKARTVAELISDEI